MRIKTSGRSVLTVAMSLGAMGLFALSFTSSAQALCLFDCPKTEQVAEKTEAAAKDEAKPVTVRKYKRYHKSRYTSRRQKAREAARRERVEKEKAERAAEIKKAETANAGRAIDSLKVPASVANANAQLIGNTQNAISRVDSYTDRQTDGMMQLVSADELNEIDKTAGQPETLPAKASSAVADSRAEMSVEQSGTWDTTSVIGKMFIAFGTLLTLFSAARMFMA